MPVTAIDGTSLGFMVRGAFAERRLTNVVIPESVAYIGHSAFAGNHLTGITFPNSIKSINSLAFTNNQLTSVIIPTGVTFIGERAFQNNPLTSITIPDSIKSLDENMFNGSYRNLIRVSIGANIDIYAVSNAIWIGFSNAYKNNGRRAGDYTRSGNQWNFQPR